MKKFFLLSLLSVLFLSAFSQIQDNNLSQENKPTVEVLANISIYKDIDDSEIPDIQHGIWILFYKEVKTTYSGGNLTLTCKGWGWKFCLPSLYSYIVNRGVDAEAVENTCNNLLNESYEKVSNGEYKGSLTKKVGSVTPETGRVDSYILYQLNWNNDPKKPYNGEAEIIISKITNFGF